MLIPTSTRRSAAEQAGLHAKALAEMELLRAGLARVESGQTRVPPLDVAAEVADLEKAAMRQSRLRWVLDPALIPAGLFRFGLSPHSDLLVRPGSDTLALIVEAMLAPGAPTAGAGQCEVRLVNPAERSVLTRAPLNVCGSRARAQIRLPVPADEADGLWVELVDDPGRPVSSLAGHLTRRALRWADAALRAARAPKGLAAQATTDADWAALAALAWQACRDDWAAAPGSVRPVGPMAGESAARPCSGPACLAEALNG